MSGKSHFFAELAIEESIADPNLTFVCIREIQKSLKFSAKKLIEDKISTLGVEHLFDITQNEIRRRGGNGIFIFQGMQDHTSDSIKSLEGFKRAWVEEAQNLSARSLMLLRPTISRNKDYEMWFSWNPDQPDDPVDAFFKNPPEGSIRVHVNYDENPFLNEDSLKEVEYDRRIRPDDFDHVWLGGYNKRSHAQVFAGKWVIDEFDADGLGEPLFGADWGFSVDPTTLVRMFIKDNVLYIDHEVYKVGMEIVDIARNFKTIPLADKYTIRADNARPETISHVSNDGLNIKAADKWAGSVEDGIEHMRGYSKIVIHPRCTRTAQEFRLYSYKVDKRTGDVLPKIEDKDNHIIDAIRYGLQPLIKRTGVGGVIAL